MALRTTKIPAIILSLAALFFATSVWSATSMNGVAEVGYTRYDAEANGSNLFSGNSLLQQYSLELRTTNYVSRYQPNYYKLMAGYSFADFSTRLTEPTQETTIKQNLGKFKYSGEFSYRESALPISITGYLKDDLSPVPRRGLIANSLIDNNPVNSGSGLHNDVSANSGLVYDLEALEKSISSGFSFNFDPKKARNASQRALPQAILEYRGSETKGSGFYSIDSRSRELTASLGRENNWIHYRLRDYKDALSPAYDFMAQQIQIGLVDYRGRRNWSELTNWISVSADALLAEEKNLSTGSNREEYDVNFMAIATRKTWDARSFMNYNRTLDTDNVLTERTNVPLYVKGIYGSETSWYASLAASRGKESHLLARTTDTAYTNTLTVGGTTFNRSQFTLSPSLSLQTSKYYNGYDAYAVSSAVETVSTRRFSEKLGLGARLSWNAKDDGAASVSSKSWSESLVLNAMYSPNSSLIYRVQNTFDFGSGYGYIDGFSAPTAYSNAEAGNYLRNVILASAGWTPNARFNTSIDGSYGIVSAANIPEYTEESVYSRARYDNRDVAYSAALKYAKKNNGFDKPLTNWIATAQTQYRPNIYNDGVLRGTYERETGGATDTNSTKLEIYQRYSYNFFTRRGVARNVATLSEESSFTRQPAGGSYNSSFAGDVLYLRLSGRYSPTDRYSLFGSAKYEKTNSPGSVTMYYNLGMTADFRLLSTSIDYTLAKRDIDNRIERRLSASVRRTF